MESRVWRRGPTRGRGLLYLARALLRGQEPARANGIDLAGVTIWRWWGWGAGCTLRDQLQVIRCWSPARPLIQESRVWVRGLTSTCQRVMHRWCLGAMAIIRTCQRDRPRSYYSRPFVGMDCRLYLAGSAACLAGSSRGPSCRIAESGCEV